MAKEKDELAEWLASMPPEDRSRSVMESGFLHFEDPEAMKVIGAATTARNQHAGILDSLLPPPKPLPLTYPRRPGFRRVRYRRPNPKPRVFGPEDDYPIDNRSEPSNLPVKAGRPLPVMPYDELGKYLMTYGHGHEIWPHFIGPFLSPPEYRPRRPMVNPFRPPEPGPQQANIRNGFLGVDDAFKLYNAIAYAMWKDGVVLNTHVIILWSQMGLTEQDGDAVLGRYLHKAQKWLRVGTKPRRRFSANARYEGTELRYAWVHESSPNRGFHSHVLLNVPPRLSKEFREWSRQCLVREIGKHFPWKAFRLVRSYAKIEDSAVKRVWSWFRYLSKQLHPEIKVCCRENGVIVGTPVLRDLLKPRPFRKSLPIPLRHLTGVSHNIGKGAQQKDGFRSRLITADYDDLYRGHEMNDWRRRLEDERREALNKSLQI